ncbi:MAG: RyR domain-containing protein [Caulobacterales bacterium]
MWAADFDRQHGRCVSGLAGDRGSEGHASQMRRRKGSFSVRAAWAIPALALTSIVLGVWGWTSLGTDLDNALYNSAGLFNNGNGAYYENPALSDWHIRLARWGGVVVLFSAALLAVATLLQQRVATTLARRTKQSVVIIGDDPLALTAFEVAQWEARSVLWLGAPAFHSTSLRIIALPWPTQDRAEAVADYTGGADHIVVAHHNDAEALTLVRAARATAPKAFITLLMLDLHLAEDAGATLNEAKTRVLSQGAVAARRLSITHPTFMLARDQNRDRIHALIVGFGQTGQAIARDLIVNCRTTYLALPRLTVIDPQARELEGVLRVRAPEIDACAQCLFIEGEVSGRAVHPGPSVIAKAIADGGPITAAYVCLSTDVEALSAAAMLQSLLRSIDLDAPPIYVRVREVNTIAPSGRANRGLDALIPFGGLASILQASEFLSNARDDSARAFHEGYRALLTPEQRADKTNRAADAWDDLDETYRQANRDAVAHIPAKLASAGINPACWRWVTGLPRLGRGERLYSNDAELEALAELEHERWMAQRRMDGWRWTDQPTKNETRRLHPSLLAYRELTDEVKEYDRANVRQTQSACGGPTSS